MIADYLIWIGLTVAAFGAGLPYVADRLPVGWFVLAKKAKFMRLVESKRNPIATASKTLMAIGVGMFVFGVGLRFG